MRHDVHPMSDPAFRKVMKKSKKKGPKSEEVKDRKPRLPETVTVVFREDAEGSYAMLNGRRAPVAACSENTVSEGQSWRCMVDRKDAFRPELIPLELISEKPEEKEMPAEVPKVEKEAEFVEVPASSEEIERLREENEKLSKENTKLRKENLGFEKYKGMCEEKDKTIKDRERAIGSLTEQVKALEKKISNSNIGSLESRIEEQEDVIESMVREIEKLREKLKAMGVDDMKVVPHLPPVMKAIKNGSTLKFRDSVEDGRYRVYVNPRAHRLLIVPDANGSVCCSGGEMRMPCIDLPSIGGEEGPRRVAIDAVGDGWEILLE